MTEQETNKELVILGEPGVGKTTLANLLAGKSFNSLSESTHGIETSFLDEDKKIKITDFGGQKIYHESHKKQIDNLDSAVALIVVDSRFNDPTPQIDYWTSILDKKTNIIKYLVITKTDAYPPYVDDKHLIEQYKFNDIYKTSAKYGSGIQELRASINSSIKLIDKAPEEYEDSVAIIVQTMADQLCQLIAKRPNALKNIEWRDLERIIATALQGLGFDVTLTSSSKDGGKDIIVNCLVSNKKKTFYIEIKHWRNGGRPGFQYISDFIQVNAKNNTDGGLFLSSSGYTNSLYDQISEVIKQNVRLGDQEKIVSLCQRYIHKNGLWVKTSSLPDLLFEKTIA